MIRDAGQSTEPVGTDECITHAQVRVCARNQQLHLALPKNMISQKGPRCLTDRRVEPSLSAKRADPFFSQIRTKEIAGVLTGPLVAKTSAKPATGKLAHKQYTRTSHSMCLQQNPRVYAPSSAHQGVGELGSGGCTAARWPCRT